MSDYDHLNVQFNDAVATITIDREDKLNALNSAIIKELKQAMQAVYDDPQINAAIITGRGEKAFAAGADISEIALLNEMNGRSYAESGQEVFQMIENSPKPVVAAVNGYALGGGCELAMACHIRVAVKSATFGQPEVNLGTIPGYGGTQRLCQLIGKARALEMMLTGNTIDALQAFEWGLVNHVTESNEEMMVTSRQLLDKITSKAPRALSMIINCVNAAFDADQNGYQTEANSFANCCKTQDFKEGTAAFLEKRLPKFTGN